LAFLGCSGGLLSVSFVAALWVLLCCDLFERPILVDGLFLGVLPVDLERPILVDGLFLGVLPVDLGLSCGGSSGAVDLLTFLWLGGLVVVTAGSIVNSDVDAGARARQFGTGGPGVTNAGADGTGHVDGSVGLMSGSVN